MKKAIIAIVVLVILALIAGGAYLFLQRDSESENSDNTTQQEGNTNNAADSDDQSALKSIADLFQSDSGQSCTWNYDDETGKGNGTIYIANNNMRQDVTVDGQEWHMIYKDNKMYSWGDAQEQGIAITVENLTDSTEEDLEEANDNISAYGNTGIDLTQDYDFDCDDWNEDASMFETPSDVEFVDYDALLDQFGELNGSPYSN